MKNQFNYKKVISILQITLLVVFFSFIFVWEIFNSKNNIYELHRQAEVISIDLWNFDTKGSIAYLKLACRLNNYEQLTVFDLDNELFARVKGPEYGRFEQLLTRVGLMQKTTLEAEIFFNSTIVGKIEAIKRHDTIYAYLYLLLILGLIALAGRYFLKTLQSRDTLELRVQERTEELQRATQLLQTSEERYREIYNASSDAIFMHDAESGKILDVNQGMLDMFGYTYDEALQIDVGSLSSGKFSNTLEEARRKIQNAVLHGPQTFEWVCRKKDGSLFWAEVVLKHTKFSGKRYVIAVNRDINVRKKAEKNLATEKEQLAVTLRSIGDGVITTDISENIVLINKVTEKLTGWNNKEAVGRPLVEVFNILDEQTRERCENPVNRALSQGRVVSLDSAVLVAKDGRERIITDSCAPIFDSDSNIIGVVLVFRDITDQIKTEKELLKIKKLESIGVLAGGIAHDFNNLLTAILGNINLALFDKDLTDRSRKLMSEAEKASLRAKDLTQQLLTFAKGGEPVTEMSPLENVIKDSANFVLRGSPVACHFEIPHNLQLVDIDKGQISQVIQNIILNASHAMPAGGVITVTCENIDSDDILNIPIPARELSVKICIRDEGIGMPNNIVEKIFDPYFSTKQEGNGLGLAITHSIISKHGGHITVESQPGDGTTFTIYLPSSEKCPELKPISSIASQTNCRGKIMIMDDEEMIRSLVERALSRSGYEVVLAEDGDEAVQLYQKAKESDAPIDLIIMDLTIPGGMGGKDAVKEIHKIDPEAKVIVSSGYSNDPVMADFGEYGFCGAVVKPFQIREFMETVGKAISS